MTKELTPRATRAEPSSVRRNRSTRILVRVHLHVHIRLQIILLLLLAPMPTVALGARDRGSRRGNTVTSTTRLTLLETSGTLARRTSQRRGTQDRHGGAGERLCRPQKASRLTGRGRGSKPSSSVRSSSVCCSSSQLMASSTDSQGWANQRAFFITGLSLREAALRPHRRGRAVWWWPLCRRPGPARLWRKQRGRPAARLRHRCNA